MNGTKHRHEIVDSQKKTVESKFFLVPTAFLQPTIIDNLAVNRIFDDFQRFRQCERASLLVLWQP